MGKPMVSVVMSVYNTAEYLSQSIDSILDQSFSDFEFIIIDDGSTDKTKALIQDHVRQDKRIKPVYSRTNQGLISSLNKAIKAASGKYIARQDPDDISMPQRLEKQLAVLENNTNIGMVGTNYQVIDEAGKVVTATDVFTHPDDIALAEIFTNQFGHGTIMARAELLKNNPYDLAFKYAEDYDLWARISHQSSLANLSEPLYQWRLHSAGATASKARQMQSQLEKIRARECDHLFKQPGKLKLFSFHPYSLHGGFIAYQTKKARLYRNLALLYYQKRSSARAAISVLLIAVLFAPWSFKSYRQLGSMVFKSQRPREAEFEAI